MKTNEYSITVIKYAFTGMIISTILYCFILSFLAKDYHNLLDCGFVFGILNTLLVLKFCHIASEEKIMKDFNFFDLCMLIAIYSPIILSLKAIPMPLEVRLQWTVFMIKTVMFYGGIMIIAFLAATPILLLFGLSPKDFFENSKKDL